MTTFDKATLDQLLADVDPNNPQSLFTDAGLVGQRKKALAERMLQAELSHHLQQQRNAPEPTRNHKNGSSKKSRLAAEAKLTLDIPRDRNGGERGQSGVCAPSGKRFVYRWRAPLRPTEQRWLPAHQAGGAVRARLIYCQNNHLPAYYPLTTNRHGSSVQQWFIRRCPAARRFALRLGGELTLFVVR